MAGRKRKRTIDWFPHTTAHGDSMAVVEERYGNDGYATWFKILERLGREEGHYIDTNSRQTMIKLASKCHLCEQKLLEIVFLFAEMGMIDAELWAEGVIWSQKYVDGIAVVYERRESSIPMRPSVELFRGKQAEKPISVNGNTIPVDGNTTEMPFPPARLHRESRVERERREREEERAHAREEESLPMALVTLFETEAEKGAYEAMQQRYGNFMPSHEDQAQAIRDTMHYCRQTLADRDTDMDPGQLLQLLMDSFAHLKRTDKGKKGFWRDMPYLPKSLWIHRAQILEHARGQFEKTKQSSRYDELMRVLEEG